MTATAAFAQRLTKHRLPPGSTRHAYGNTCGSFGFSGSSFFASSLRPSGGLGGSPFPGSFFATSGSNAITFLLSGFTSGTRTTASAHGIAANRSLPAGSNAMPPTTPFRFGTLTSSVLPFTR